MDKRKDIIKYRFADPQKAYDICCELLEQGMQSGNDYEVAYAYLYMGDTLFSMGKCEEALRYTALAETIQKQNGFDNLLMKTCNIIGVIYVNMGDALLAMDYYHSALDLAKTYRNYILMAMVYSNIGSLLSEIGDTEEAIKYYKQANECSKKEGIQDSDLSFNPVLLYVNICEGYINAKQYDKAKEFLSLKNDTKNGKIAFVGDGINDAPTLALADVGISMGSGSDISHQSADMILTNSSLHTLLKSIQIAKKTKIIIYQNITFALIIKGVFMVLGLFGVAEIWEAVFGDVGVALLALANAMRALRL